MGSDTCVRGCVAAGRHRTGCANCACCCHTGGAYGPPCDVAGGCYSIHEQACRGCLPRPARHGRLCSGCHTRMADWFGAREPDVHGMAWVLGWLSRNVAPGASTRESDGSRSLKHPEAPAPVNLNAIVVRDELLSSLAGWVECACDQLGMAGPRQRTLVSAIEWLAAQLERIEGTDFVGPMWDELSELMSRAHAAAPWRASPRLLVGVPCPGCHRRTMVIYGGEIDAQCRVCRTVIPSHTYGIWIKIVTRELGPREVKSGNRTESPRPELDAAS